MMDGYCFKTDCKYKVDNKKRLGVDTSEENTCNNIDIETKGMFVDFGAKSVF